MLQKISQFCRRRQCGALDVFLMRNMGESGMIDINRVWQERDAYQNARNNRNLLALLPATEGRNGTRGTLCC